MARFQTPFFSLVAFCLITGEQVRSGPLAEALGIYEIEEGQTCAGNEISQDSLCIPIASFALHPDEVSLAIFELTDPDRFAFMLNELARQNSTFPEAYEIEIEDYEDNRFFLRDGAILERRSPTHVGHIGYREEAILYFDYGSWRLCFNGRNYRVTIIEDGSRHYSRQTISLSLSEILDRQECD